VSTQNMLSDEKIFVPVYQAAFSADVMKRTTHSQTGRPGDHVALQTESFLSPALIGNVVTIPVRDPESLARRRLDLNVDAAKPAIRLALGRHIAT
jgi:hypothetical protein